MKTALTELIEYYEKKWSKKGMGCSISVSSVLAELKNKLPKERQDLIDIAKEHIDQRFSNEIIQKAAEQYVKEKFGI